MTNDFSIVQCIYNRSHYPPEEMQKILQAAEEDESSAAKLLADNAVDIAPYRTAVLKAMGDDFPREGVWYAKYVELFMNGLKEQLHTEAVVEDAPCTVQEERPNYAASQRLTGDISIVAGLIAPESVYLRLAERYSEEEFSEVDEMAVDCITELINVINGLLSVELGKEKIETDLELPRHGQNVVPQGSKQLCLRVHSAVGSFQIVMAESEFI
ncbi:MAG: chemotaxis protein CheX [Selenomonas sp.]|nr:chemotaxis protein CheX [Selenomonas sp.]